MRFTMVGAGVRRVPSPVWTERLERDITSRHSGRLDEIEACGFMEQAVLMPTSGLTAALGQAQERLLSLRHGRVWTGELSSSPHATAAAAIALIHGAESPDLDALQQAQTWLIAHQQEDGGWGHTDRSPSDFLTTLLVWSALSPSLGLPEHRAPAGRARSYLVGVVGHLSPSALVETAHRLGHGQRLMTQAILAACAECGRLGPRRDAWRHISHQPFEIASGPWQAYHLFRATPSTSLPLLVALGQARHSQRPSSNPFVRLVRQRASQRTLDLLRSLQPEDGGFLSSPAFTGMVTYCLGAAGVQHHWVTRRGIDFLRQTRRPDGSWPAHGPLATWQTALALGALAKAGTLGDKLPAEERQGLCDWLLSQQFMLPRSLFTPAPPGGWAWTDMPGSQPESDGTAQVLMALHHLDCVDHDVHDAVTDAIAWLGGNLNRDGGQPPFDRGALGVTRDPSGTAITADVLMAIQTWQPRCDMKTRMAIDTMVRSQERFLLRAQRHDGSWVPRWFTHPQAPGHMNLTYGTACVLRSLASQPLHEASARAVHHGVVWLLATQHPTGAWGPAAGITPSIEESALALESLATVLAIEGDHTPLGRDDRPYVHRSIARGVNWLLEHTQGGRFYEPAPIGLLPGGQGYYDHLYPITFTVAALGQIARLPPAPPR